jgi:hypothetical protein
LVISGLRLDRMRLLERIPLFAFAIWLKYGGFASKIPYAATDSRSISLPATKASIYENLSPQPK